MTLADLAKIIGAQIERGEPSLQIGGVANLSEAGPAHLAPYTSSAYQTQLKQSRARAVVLKRGESQADVPPAAAVLSSDDPEIAFLKAIGVFHPRVTRPPSVHATAVIAPGVELGTDVHIGPHVSIEAGSRIGARCVILANCAIGPDCELGDDCVLNPNVTLYHKIKLGQRVILHSGVVLGADGFGYKFRAEKHVKVPHVGWVEIADDVEIGANSCVDRGTLGPTRIGAGTKIDNLVQIAHNNDVGKHCLLCGQVALAGSCTLGDYVTLGGGTGVADHATIGMGARAGGRSGISGVIPPGQEVWGLIAQEKKKAFRSYAALRHLPDLVDRVRKIEKALDEKS